MSYFHYDRLSALDAAFLDLEDGNAHMHIGSVAIFEGKPLTGDDGSLDFDQIVESSGATLCRNVRLRQKLVRVPGLGHPVWVDDDRFNVLYHLRHTRLPTPGSIRMLKRLAGRVMSQQLDRGRPLWEMWFVEGVEDGRFAVITKIHHCLADGISGADILSKMMGPDPDFRPQHADRYIPRPAPSGARLLADELTRRAAAPISLLRAGGQLVADAGPALRDMRDGLRGLRDSFGAAFAPASATPFNTDLGPHRRFDWTRFELDAVKELKARVGGKLNDVVLAVVAGAVRRFLAERGLRVDDLDFRTVVPVNVRSHSEAGALGNRVSQVLVRLPVDEPDPLARIERVLATTRAIKSSAQSSGGQLLNALGEWTGSGVISRLVRLALAARAANVVVTNVPGPPQPIFMLGSRLLEVYPVVPLASQQTLGIAVFSYAGGLHWGLNADWEALPDLHALVEAIDEEFEALRKLPLARVEAREHDA